MKQLLPENNNSNGSPVLAADYAAMEPAASHSPQSSSFKLQKFFLFLLKYWPIPLLTLVLGVAGGLAYVMTQPPTFVSHARLWETVRLRLPENSLFSEGDAQNYIGTQTELLESGALHDLAIARIKSLSTNNIPLEKDGLPMPVHLTVAASSKSSVFTVVGAAADPGYVQTYVEALINEYVAYKRDVRKTVAGDTIASITEQVLRLEQELKTAQEALSAYQKSNNLFVLQEQAKVTGSYLATLNTQLSDEELQLRFLESGTNNPPPQSSAAGDTSNSIVKNAAMPPAAPGSSQPDEQLQMLKYQRARLSVNLRPKHPKIVALDDEIAKSEKMLEIVRTESQAQLEASRHSLMAKIDARKTAIKEWEAKAANANNLLAESEDLQRKVNRIQVVYERLDSVLQNVDISRNIDQETLAILEHGSPPVRSYEAETGTMTKCSLGGLFAGLGIVFLLALRDDKFTSTNEVNEKFGDVIVGQVPDVRGSRKKAPLELVQDNDDRHMYAESYRNLRSALLFLTPDGQRPKLILVTSAVPNEGKSTISANLARIMAVGGARVLLVDGDMRRGAIHKQLGLNQEPGFTDLLQDPRKLDSILQIGAVPNLTFIGRGTNMNNPGDLLLGPQLDLLLTEFRKRFDYVVVDSCPVFAADDVTTLAPKLDGTLFVVRSQFSRARIVQEALELLYQRQAKVLGLVFNRAKSSSRTGYSYYRYADYHQPQKRT